MNKFQIYIGLILLGVAFGGGFALSSWLNRPGEIQPLSVDALKALRAKMAELGAKPAETVTKWETLTKEVVPDEIRKEMEALREAAGREPEAAVAFDLRPDEVAPLVEVTCDPCGSESMRVTGFAQKSGVDECGESLWAWKADLSHYYGEMLVWKAPLRGNFTILEPPQPVSPFKWFAGPSVRLDWSESPPSYAVGGVVGRNWKAFTALAGADSGGAWAAGAVRFGRR